MDPMTGLAIASVAAPVIGGLMGANASAGDRAAAQAAYQRAYSQFDNINIPDTEKMRLALQELTQQGIITPTAEQAEQLGISAMEGVTTDPRLRQAQMNALDTLAKMGEQGLTATDLASLNQMRRSVGGDAQARDASILQNMAARGVGGSGVELATRLAANQRAADIAAQQSDQLAAMAQQRMLAAVSQAGQLGGQIRGQEFGEQADKARAADMIAQFNAAQRAGVQQRNVAGLNAAQAANLAEKQRVADTNVATRNAEQQYNKGLEQQRFNNQMALAGARSNALTGQAQQYQNQADSTAQMWAGLGRGVGEGAAGFGQYLQGRRDRTNAMAQQQVQNAQQQQILDALYPKKPKYGASTGSGSAGSGVV